MAILFGHASVCHWFFRINSDEFLLLTTHFPFKELVYAATVFYAHNGQVKLLTKQKGNSNRINERLSRRRIYHLIGRCTIYYIDLDKI